MLHAIIMAGGSGTRFWPKSRRNRPKQLLRLYGERSLLQDTVARVATLVSPERTWIVTGADQAWATREQLPQLPVRNIVAEPCPRDTAPCVGLAAALVETHDKNATMVVLPADHIVRPESAFQKTVQVALGLIESDPAALVTMGVRPTRPETGYGYIERGELLGTTEGIGISRVAMFREKPNRETAEHYVAAGTFAWNSGVFVWRAETILNELRAHCPEIGLAIERISASIGTAQQPDVISREYEALPRAPIDKAVMEKAKNVYVLEVTYEWSDVGDWRSLAELMTRDSSGNTAQGPVLALDCRNCVVIADEGKLLAALGVDGLVIVQSGGATLVARKDQLDNLRQLVAGLDGAGFGAYT